MRTLVRVPVALVAIAAIGAVAASCSAVRPSALTVNGNDLSRDSVDRQLSAIAGNPSLKNEIAATEGTIKSGGSTIWLTHVVAQEVVDREVHRRGIRVTTPGRTVIDFLRELTLPDAVAIADAAVRDGMTNVSELRLLRHLQRRWNV